MRDLSKALIRPGVAEALAGEFNPPTDKQKRAHSLSRLALSAYQKGAEAVSPRPGFVMSTRRPTWAPQAEIVTDWDRVFGDANKFSSLKLTDVYGNELSITDHPSENHMTLFHGQEFILSLEPGKDLVVARHNIHEATQRFFDNSARALAQFITLDLA